MVEEIRSRIEQALEGAEVTVAGEGSRFDIRVVSRHFEGLSRVKRQQAVYAALRDLISSGAIHAVTIQALADAESP